MKKTASNEVGSIVYWTDFIRSKYRRTANGPVVEYDQSNTQLDGFCARTIGICRRESGWVVSVALSKDEVTEKTERSGKGVVLHRIKNLIANNLSTTAQDKGITWVPYSYKSLLYNDPMAFNTLFGPLDPSSLNMATKLLDER